MQMSEIQMFGFQTFTVLCIQLQLKFQLKYPSKIPSLETLGFENAILALIEFLTQVRHKLNGLTSKKVTTLPIVDGPVIESKTKLMEIIDTTLLKCYLLTKSSSLVASLLRLKVRQN